jgi:hypothetical protein
LKILERVLEDAGGSDPDWAASTLNKVLELLPSGIQVQFLEFYPKFDLSIAQHRRAFILTLKSYIKNNDPRLDSIDNLLASWED